MNMTKLFLLSIIIMSSLITISANNWMGMWMGLEINLMAFIPLISSSKNKKSSQAMMIYFLTQSLGSITFLFSILLNSMLFMSPLFIEELTKMMIMIGLMIKVGAAPFHMWLPEMMSNLGWMECLILMTWQKLAPLVIMNNMIPNNMFVYISSSMSAMLGAIGGVNQTSLRKIMAYSSINHLGWMLLFMSMNSMWYKYLMIYSIMMVMICILFYKKNTYFINQINLSSYSSLEKYICVMMMLSLGGLPPFLGFLPKWMVIQSMIKSNLNMMLLIMMLFSLITLFFYMRMMSSMILSYTMINKWNSSKNKLPLFSMMFMNLSLPLFSVFSFF
uniref:NADH-ubiquinone oxidoreductase chain 2 n=1 Tax=Aeschyntelus notatus TaxID=498933 RepID=B7SM75_9HEMI|nr:NADH dehydrogenase subunit 2 [Aeschyntelus notatus]ABZ01969.1 NADH dehydrogenase subunit 2 [Aeschyntelus notatus]